MIDRIARRQLAEAIRALAAGCISNDEFERRVSLPSSDPAIEEIFKSGAWFLYDDIHEHRLVDRYKPSQMTKSNIARWVLFLKTDMPYQWPRLHWWKQILYALSMFISLGLARHVYTRRRHNYGDDKAWPFYRCLDVRIACRKPIYLAGLSAN